MLITGQQLEQLLASPALAPPKGVTPDFENPPNRNSLAMVITTLCMVLITLCVLLRSYCRIWREREFHIVEALMFCAYVASWVTAYAAYKLIETPGYYVHTWNLRMGDLVDPAWLILLYGCSYSIVMPCIKTSILLYCRRAFGVDNNYICRATTILISIQWCWGILCVVLLNLQCRPHSGIWEFWKCHERYKLPDVMLASASVQLFTDVITVVLPLPVIWRLQMSLRKKLGLTLVFGIGVLACIAAGFRLDQTVTFSREADTMWYIGPLLFWADAETACGFLILSVTCLPKMIREISFPARVKRAFGTTIKLSNRPNENFGYGPGSSHDSRAKPPQPSDNNYELRGGNPHADSQECLRGPLRV